MTIHEHFAYALREVERACNLKPLAPCTFEGFQEWPHRYNVSKDGECYVHEDDCPACVGEPLALFTLTAPVGRYPKGTTLSGNTLKRLGFSLPSFKVPHGPA